MATFRTSDGCTLHYELTGEGPLVALTPGGREAGAALSALVQPLSRHCRVLTWDRRNTGASDLFLEAGRGEQAVWAEDLAELVRALGLGPAILAGGSAGCRVSLNAAIRHPEIARGLILWSASGGAYGAQFLGFQYHVPYIMAARRGGMAAVAKTPFFAERIAANPANGERLMALDPADFVAALKRWNEDFYHRPGEPLAGVLGDLGAITAPVLVFDGNDDIHPPAAAQALAGRLANARLAPSPWSSEAWMGRFSGRIQGSVFDLYPALAEPILGFIADLPPAGR